MRRSLDILCFHPHEKSLSRYSRKRLQSIDKVDALPSKVSKQTFDGNINFL